ncbi:MAG: DUF2203 family protein [Planctomycetes bacterium]|nr:DUF2203 family protein [Planctomycetota bacterium]
MKNAYNHEGAKRLIPLIEAIHRELRERAEALRDLNVRLHQLRNGRERLARRVRAMAELNVRADIANQRRELRLAEKELKRLGCLLDEANPFRVLIPGRSGELTDGYAWRAGEEQLMNLVNDGPEAA